MPDYTVYKVLRDIPYVDIRGERQRGYFSINTPAWKSQAGEMFIDLSLRLLPEEHRFAALGKNRQQTDHPATFESDHDVQRHLIYRLGEWTMPIIPSSKLFVFRSENDARLYASGLHQHIVIARGIAPDIEKAGVTVPDLKADIVDFWNDPTRDVNDYHSMDTPTGTYFASRVLLVDIISYIIQGTKR